MLSDKLKEKLKKNFNSRNIDIIFFDNCNQASDYILDNIPLEKTVGIGNSITLKKMNISEKLNSSGYTVYDKTNATTKEEVRKLKKQALVSDYYITGTNAISEDGHIVNIDHSGNRVAAMIYGPDKVFIVIGENKLSHNLVDAKSRVRNISAPLNAKRAGYTPPCLDIGHCVDCRGENRVCNYCVVVEGQYVKDRMTVILISENLGF